LAVSATKKVEGKGLEKTIGTYSKARPIYKHVDLIVVLQGFCKASFSSSFRVVLFNRSFL
jgi:hypothetical protein